MNGQSNVVEVFAKYGPDIDAADDEGSTPLMQPAANGHVDVVQVLLRRGPNVERVDSDGRTALWLAESNCHAVIAEILRSARQKDSCGGDKSVAVTGTAADGQS